MPGIGEAVYFGDGEAPAPFVEEVTVEHEIALTPANQYRQRGETVQSGGDLVHQIETAISRSQRNVLHETQDGDAIPPGIIGSEITLAHLRRQWLCHAITDGPAAEGVQS